MLSSFVLRNLKGKLQHDVWQEIAPSIGIQPGVGQEMNFVRSNGEPIFTWLPEEIQDQFSVSRWRLREGLLHWSESFARFGKMFDRYEKLSNGGQEANVPNVQNTTHGCYSDILQNSINEETFELAGSHSGVMAFCPGNQNILVHSWQNPLKPWATEYTEDEMEPSESFIIVTLIGDAVFNIMTTLGKGA
ncbi:hypothetical protein DID88_001226 [Monilinia fructigena]|uniref:Uncharacterized protein n=1 Tax=Monilinia fructigena TaxID=38457 RepID=A0A395IXV6_9HELO|nr:hypothetical protein DID88_001226 [Monilinia fructigena]